MRLEFDRNRYVSCILYGCYTDSSIIYTGLVPNEPEEYEDMDDWAARARTEAYYLNNEGNLAYDAVRAEMLCAEDEIIPAKYTHDQIKAMGIFEAIYPVGSLYMSMNDVDPSILFGGTWKRIEDRFILASGSLYEGGTENADGISQKVTVNIPAHKHLTPVYDNNGGKIGVWTGGDFENVSASKRTVAVASENTSSTTLKTYYTKTDGACSTNVTVPPTLPPYMAVFVWQRIEDPVPECFRSFIDREGKTMIDADNSEFMVEEE